jgi:hypothetical protein
LEILCFLNQARPDDSSESGFLSKDSLVQEAYSAAMLHQTCIDRATEVKGRRLLRGLKRICYEAGASLLEPQLQEARCAIAVRQVVSLSDLRTRRKWFGER